MISIRHSTVALGGLVLVASPELRAQAADTLVPPENLVPDGMPPIPRSLVDQVRPYTEYRSAGLADWHPSRREMLIATRFASTPQIHRLSLPRGSIF